MLDRARAVHADSAKVFYEQQDFEAFAGSTSEKPLDVIYSNSALHWVSFEVQKTLLPRLLSRLVPGGIIAFQIPDTRVQPSHLLMRTAAAATNLPVESVRWVTCERDPRDYYEILAPHCSQVTLWSTDYTLVLNGENPVADFTASTGLGPYIDKAGGPDSDAGKLFVEKYRQMIAEAYPKNADGTTLFNFKRFFAVATKKVL
ncbi:hypothetical protein HDU82_002998 [Entophlyctis luteolus]|nr:hypothetical protein HDU82_002998 [Entophlyctis luteolus]